MGNHPDDIGIVEVADDGVDELLRLYADLFHDREPLTRWIGFGKERMISMARAMHASDGDGALPGNTRCWTARTGADGNTAVGFIVCDDPATEGNPSLPDDLTDEEKRKMSAVMALLGDIRDPVQDRRGLGSGKCLHVAAIGVAPGYEGKGIAKRLLRTALSDAEERGFQFAFAECTSLASRVLHEGMGFECLKTASARTLVAKGDSPFADCDLEIHLMAKRLRSRN